MMTSEMTWQVNEWLVLLAGFVALYVVILWPAVKGKWCLVVSLSLILLPEVLNCLLPYFINRSEIDETGLVYLEPEEYQNLWMYSMTAVYLSLFGKFLFVVAMFRLGSELRKLRVLFSTEIEAR